MGQLTQSTVTLQGLINNIPNLAPLASPNFTGSPIAPTQAPTDVSTKIATTAFVDSTNKNITTITFNRTDNTAVSPATPVLITINAVPSSGLTVTKNAAGQILSLPCANLDANASIVYDRAAAGTTNTVDATKTMTQTKTYNVGGTTSTKTRTITRNNLNEILTISAWA